MSAKANKSKSRSKSKYKELGLGLDSNMMQEETLLVTLDAIGKVMEGKIANLATKECIHRLCQTVVSQNEKIEALEAKIVIMEKYIERLEKFEEGYAEVKNLHERVKSLELRSHDNEQYNRRLYLRLNGIKVDKDKDESGKSCLSKIKSLLEDELELEIPDTVIDRAHRIGPIKEGNEYNEENTNHLWYIEQERKRTNLKFNWI